MFSICWNCLKSDCLTSLEGFEWFFKFFDIALPFQYWEKLKNSIFEIPIIPQTLNINNYRNTRTKSINLHIIRRLIRYSLKKPCLKAMLTFTVFETLLFEVRSVLWSSQWVTGSEKAKKNDSHTENVELRLLKKIPREEQGLLKHSLKHRERKIIKRDWWRKINKFAWTKKAKRQTKKVVL